MNIIKPGRFQSCLNRLLCVTLLSGFVVQGVCELKASSLKFIAVSATAVPSYVRPKDADGKPRPETYIFTQGKFFGGTAKDARLNQIKFEDIVKNLAPNLAKQNYFPTRDVPSANIMIMVHWGTTEAPVDPQKDFLAEKTNDALNNYRSAAANNDGDADPGELNMALADQSYAQGGAQANIARNSSLLGYKPTLEKEQRKLFPSTDEMTMSEELNEERYFVILMAYDYQYMKKEHKSRLLWATRISVRSPGNNFLEAMPALVEAGADVYGRQVNGLVRVDAPTRGGRVDLGELKVMGTVEEPKTDGKKK